MGKQGQEQFNWRKMLGILALSLGTAGAMEARAVAAPQAAEDIYLAQVGVRSRINSPTPLNLRPRTHIPLPHSRYRSRHNRHRNYRHNYDNYGYGDSYNRGSYRQRRSHRRYRDYDRREDKYGDQYRRDRYEHRHRRQRPGGSITIYF